jgi:hypothetical protein
MKNSGFKWNIFNPTFKWNVFNPIGDCGLLGTAVRQNLWGMSSFFSECSVSSVREKIGAGKDSRIGIYQKNKSVGAEGIQLPRFLF